MSERLNQWFALQKLREQGKCVNCVDGTLAEQVVAEQAFEEVEARIDAHWEALRRKPVNVILFEAKRKGAK